mmetsp:Transcript_6862/g.12919  ORF Transcript_6862/g.12919 Transcript_6862/m.12919 type:complete len:489 (+) Transcript_6862:2548-4014(+)|eukprot:CAMPEP_0176492052 /NCGR_PEP_ID=MMETSP0200_2-20121128/8766_1 /TAXON_ID=947934 /ORGANISM="Chaetoceros sp., Strain GSL56" /LENGTH=488 /DNA_ID=CAMNT_0017889535 /DNA_START=428 /DNA_END=1894 /DNA_ORIENTATION=+
MERTYYPYPDSDDDSYHDNDDEIQNQGKAVTPFDKLPNEILFHIFSFFNLPTVEAPCISPPRFEIVSCLDETFENTSDYLEEKVKEFVQMSPIRYSFWWREETNHEVVWLCDNQIRIGALDAITSDWIYWSETTFVYLLEQGNLTDLGEVIVDFSGFDETPISLNYCRAAEAGIPEEAMDRIRDILSSDDDSRLVLQRHTLQVICNRASKKCVDVHFTGMISEGGGIFDLEYVSSQLVKLPLKKLHLKLDTEDGEPFLSQDDFAILSKGIESFSKLESLSMNIPGDCDIRSTSLRHLEYRGQKELVSCECPLLESISLFIMNNKPGTLQLLSRVSHCIKKLWLNFDSQQRKQNIEQLAEIIHNMPLLEELSIYETDSFEENYKLFPLPIKSKSVRRIKLVSCGNIIYLSSCICPKLEMIECEVDANTIRNYNRMAFPLVPVDDGLFHSLVKWYCDEARDVFKFRDCPFTGCEVPGDCLIKLREFVEDD